MKEKPARILISPCHNFRWLVAKRNFFSRKPVSKIIAEVRYETTSTLSDFKIDLSQFFLSQLTQIFW